MKSKNDSPETSSSVSTRERELMIAGVGVGGRILISQAGRCPESFPPAACRLQEIGITYSAVAKWS